MIAKFTETRCENAINHSNTKETVDTMVLIGHKKGEFHELVTVRCYMGRSSQASVVYCSVWINGRAKGVCVSGRGSAGGCGYHKRSAAMQSALRSAGVVLYGSPYIPDRHGEKIDYKKQASISGVGESAMEDALFAIGEALGFTRKQLYICRG